MPSEFKTVTGDDFGRAIVDSWLKDNELSLSVEKKSDEYIEKICALHNDQFAKAVYDSMKKRIARRDELIQKLRNHVRNNRTNGGASAQTT